LQEGSGEEKNTKCKDYGSTLTGWRGLPDGVLVKQARVRVAQAIVSISPFEGNG